MSRTTTEISALEERLRQAELGPDAKTFDELLADHVILLSQDGQGFTKAKVVEAHQPGKGQKFTRVDMREMNMIDYGDTAVVTCQGDYESAKWKGSLRFLRVWHKLDGGWRIIAASVFNA